MKINTHNLPISFPLMYPRYNTRFKKKIKKVEPIYESSKEQPFDKKKKRLSIYA